MECQVPFSSSPVASHAQYLFLETVDEAFLFLATYIPLLALYNLIDLLLVNTKQNLYWVLTAPMHIKKL